MRALSNRYSAVPPSGTIEPQADGRFARHGAKIQVADRAIALSVYEIEARWREPYERPHAFICAA